MNSPWACHCRGRLFVAALVLIGALSDAVGREAVAAEPATNAKPVKLDEGLTARWQFTKEMQNTEGRFEPQAGKWAAERIGKTHFATQRPHAIRLEGNSGEKERIRIQDDLSSGELPSKALTVEAWVKIDKPTEWGGIVSALQDNGDFERGWILGYNATHFYFGVSSTRRRRLSYLGSRDLYQDGYWYHVVGTYDGSRQTIYVDGRMSAQSTSQQGEIVYPPNGPFTVGAYHDDNELHSQAGEIETVSIWNRALSAAEVRDRYELRKDKFPEIEPAVERTADWPTYAGDNWRSARADVDLQWPLRLSWRLKMRHAPQPAWPPPAKQDFWNKKYDLQPRVTFDRHFHLASVQDRLYFGSSADDQLYCLDTATGNILWRFFAEAPIRLAPTIADGKVIFGADDGYVYCLDAQDGSLVWKYRDAAANRWIPGNQRLINAWPVRTGVLVEEKQGYFFSGLFPGQGTHLTVVDTDTGKPRARGQTSISPQGYLARRAGRLFTPTGRDIKGRYVMTLRRQGKDPVDDTPEIPAEYRSSRLHCGHYCVGGGNGKIAAFDLRNGKQVWDAAVEGVAGSTALARGRLFVSTDLGYVYCFTADAAEPTLAEQPTFDHLFSGTDSVAFADLAKDIARRSEVRRGYCLVLDDDGGQLAYALAQRTELKIVVLESDPAAARQMRDRLSDAGVYGRVVVHILEKKSKLPYTDYIFNLVVRNPRAEARQFVLERNEILRVLRPHGGVAMHIIENSELYRRGPLDGVGEWTHLYANAANTACSSDQRVGGKFALQWFGLPGPQSMIDRHHRSVGPLYKSGYLYVPGNNRVIALDAYNGTTLWEVEVPASRRVAVLRDCGSMAAADEGVYVATADNCWLLDARSGQRRATFRVPTAPDEKPRHWGYTAWDGNLLFGSAVQVNGSRRGHSLATIREGTYWDFRPVVSSDAIFAFDRLEDQLKWRYAPTSGRILNPTITIGEDRVFFVQTADSKHGVSAAGRVRLDKAFAQPARLVALEAETGKLAWETTVDFSVIHHHLFAAFHDGVLVTVGSYNNPRGKKGGPTVWYDVRGFDADSGKLLWSRTQDNETKVGGEHGEQDHHPVIVGDRLFVEPIAYDLKSGRLVDDWGWNRGHRRGCGTISASACAFFFRDANPTMFDLARREHAKVTQVTRPGCWINMIPAGGLLLVPESSSGCTCDFSVQGSMGFLPIRDKTIQAELSPLSDQ